MRESIIFIGKGDDGLVAQPFLLAVVAPHSADMHDRAAVCDEADLRRRHRAGSDFNVKPTRHDIADENPFLPRRAEGDGDYNAAVRTWRMSRMPDTVRSPRPPAPSTCHRHIALAGEAPPDQIAASKREPDAIKTNACSREHPREIKHVFRQMTQPSTGL